MTATPQNITLELLSPMRMGATPAGALDVDQGVVVDANGLPYLPQRRIVSRLRDALDDVCSAWKDEETALAATALVGEPGTTGGPGRLLALSDGVLDPSITAAVAALLDRTAGNNLPLRNHLARTITAAVTAVETTTSADDYRAPVEGTRRDVRELIPGLLFHARLQWAKQPSAHQVRVLARALLALTQMGGEETRGCGELETMFDTGWEETRQVAFAPGPPAPLEATPAIAVPAKEPAANPRPGPAAGDTAAGDPADSPWYVPVEMVLGSELVSNAGDPTVHIIAGTALRGALAARLHGDPDRLRRLVLDGIVRFSPAHPVIRHDGEDRMLFPAPRNIFTTDDGELVDQFDVPDPDERLHRPGTLLTQDLQWAGVPQTTVVQRINRQSGIPFRTTAYLRGQVFLTELAIHAPDGDGSYLQDLADVFTEPLRVGGNARSGFGGALQCTLGRPGPRSLFAAPLPEEDMDDAGDGVWMDLVLRSPALLRDPATGQFDPARLPHAVQELCDRVLGPAVATVGQWSLGSVAVGGFNARFHGLRPEHLAAAAGSVVRIRIGVPCSAASWAALQGERLGERGIDGFGIWALTACADAIGTRPDQAQVRRDTGPAYTAPHAPGTGPSPAVESFQQRLYAAVTAQMMPDIFASLRQALMRPGGKSPAGPKGLLGDARTMARVRGGDVATFLDQRSPETRAACQRIPLAGAGYTTNLWDFWVDPVPVATALAGTWLASWALDERPPLPEAKLLQALADDLRVLSIEYLHGQAAPAGGEGVPDE